ncbi:hypothetical protein [Dyella sp. S184]|uniref:hypothetical protein n=1 Tax=Dyella sp. S184 TaxID=1641862 RepID=UPI00131E567B|nr:hypothetical protein [Dyella sp. S184]
MLLGALYAVLRGQDDDWDLKNYHLYSPWALLHGRLALDLAPAGMQSFFNPLPDLPYFLLGMGPLRHLPHLLAGVQGLWYGGLVFVLLQIAIRLSGVRERPFGAIDLLAVLIGATGTMVMSQAGRSSNEVPLALLILLGLYLLLPLCGSAPVSKPVRRVLLAGFLCGLAVGLKPTAMVYPPALGFALLVALDARASTWRMAPIYAVGALLGFMLVYGWWGWQLYRLTGNPVFPMFNELFHSNWGPAVSDTDRLFMPRDLGQWLFYPFYWIKMNHGVVTEQNSADGRYALEMLSVIVLVVTSWLTRSHPLAGARVMRLLVAFVVVGYVLWLGLFSILRYAVPLEVLSGLLLMMALQALPASKQADGTSRRWPTRLMAGLLVLLFVFGRYPGWGRGPYASMTFDVHPPTIERNSLVLVVGQPAAYVIPFLADAQTSQYIGLTWFNRQARGYRPDALVRERIAGHHGTIYALLRNDAGVDLDLLQQFLPGAQMSNCEPVQSSLELDRNEKDESNGLRICQVKRG